MQNSLLQTAFFSMKSRRTAQITYRRLSTEPMPADAL
jgi:hypothetical protein